MNIPNTLTLLRIILIPVLVLVFYLPYSWSHVAAASIFAVAGITDWLDGYLARKLNQSTPFGAFLDPVADKMMVSIALVLLVESHASPWFTFPAMIIVGREIIISALREWMAELGEKASVAVSYLAKIKTTVQIVAITVMLAVGVGDYGGTLYFSGYALLYIAAFLTLWSMLIYLKAAMPALLGR